ncbi:MAG: hypothetical protein U0528_01335 [Anaerolineae bacterium]
MVDAGSCTVARNPATLIFDFDSDNDELEFNSPRFTADGKRLLLGAGDGIARIYDTSTGQEIRELAADDPQALTSVDWSPDGRYVIGGGVGSALHLWSVGSGLEVQTLTIHNGDIRSVMYSQDGTQLLSAANDRTIRTWRLVLPSDPHDLKGNLLEVYTLAVSPDGRYLASGGNDRSVRLYDLATGEQLRYFSSSITSSNGNPINGASVNTAHDDSVTNVYFSPDGKFILSTSDDGFVRQWSVADGTMVSALEYPNRESTYAGIYTPDGKQFITTSSDGTLRRWDSQTYKELMKYEGHEGPAYGLVLTSDGKFMISGGADGTMRLWNIETGELLHTFVNTNPETGEADPVFGMTMSADGKYLFASGPNPTVRMFDASSGNFIKEFKGHTKPVQTLVVSRDGKLLLSGSQDGSVRLWGVETGKEIRRYLGLTDAVSVAIFSPDEKYVIAGSWAREIRVWDTTVNDLITYACTQAFRDFTSAERALFQIDDTEPTCPQFGIQATPMPATSTMLPDYHPPAWTPVNTPTIAPTATPGPTDTPVPTETLNGILITFTPSARSNPQGIAVTPTP